MPLKRFPPNQLTEDFLILQETFPGDYLPSKAMLKKTQKANFMGFECAIVDNVLTTTVELV